MVVTFYEMCYNLTHRGIVQLVERRSPKPNVVGSSPASPASEMIGNNFENCFVLK